MNYLFMKLFFLIIGYVIIILVFIEVPLFAEAYLHMFKLFVARSVMF